METRIKNQVMTFFKIGGFHLRSEIAMLVVDKAKVLSDQKRKEFIDRIYSSIQNQTLETANIEKGHMLAAIRECTQGRYNEDNETVFSVINAFDVPACQYSRESKKFILKKNPKNILPSADSRSEYIRERYHTILQRILRHDLFAPNINENIKTLDNNQRKFTLKYAENLLSTSTLKEVVMLGLLSKFKEGKFYLEDPSGTIPIDLSEAKFHSGLYTEGAFVLAEGSYNDGILKVSGLGFPPPEAAASSRAYFGNLNYWGGQSSSLLKHSKSLLEFERLNFGGTIIFLSDCWLDDPKVIEKLKKLFMGFDDTPPIAIIMMGPFLKNKENISGLRRKFALLGEILDSTFSLKNETHIVLVPDIEDPNSANILPRPPLPTALVQDFMRRNKRVILATNPCRLQYCTQQIVVCRMELLKKLCRNTIKFPEEGQLADHFARTLICQGTLAPFTQLVMPTYWDFDPALSLYPLPDLIVMGDKTTDFQKIHSDCIIINTGSFPRSKFSFKLYMPGTRTIEDSQIPDDEENE
ncbi:CLUMA_CG012639, isoform A [Clunio marinus]|uniref:DNA polymerase epsilon subunit n=1 Tax=Clunio marinus TaxID=568069 RepID=A0A1J1IK30_9DIPT|nr:CLUMA_CG012639, isoform A [Clunio marinus]